MKNKKRWRGLTVRHGCCRLCDLPTVMSSKLKISASHVKDQPPAQKSSNERTAHSGPSTRIQPTISSRATAHAESLPLRLRHHLLHLPLPAARCRFHKKQTNPLLVAMAAAKERPYQPTLPWRWTSAAAFGTVGFLSRSFLYALNKTEVRGLERFLEILDGRRDEKMRTKGLITGDFTISRNCSIGWC